MSLSSGALLANRPFRGGPFPPVYNVKSLFGAFGDGVHDDTAAIQAAVSAAWSNYGIVFYPPGTYLISEPIIVQPSTAANSLAPSMIAFGSGGTTEATFTSSVLIAPSNSFPSGEYLIAYLPYSSSYQLIGYEVGGFGVIGKAPGGTTVGAGIGALNARQSHWHDISISETVTPAPVKTATGDDTAGFNPYQSGSPGGFNKFERITISQTGQDGVLCASQESVFDTIRTASIGRFGFQISNMAMTIVNCSADSSGQSQIYDGNSSAILIGFNSFTGPTTGPTIQLNNASSPTFIGCELWGPQGSGPNDNNGAIVNTWSGGSASFIGCKLQGYSANTLHLVSAQTGATGAVRFIGGSVSGTFGGKLVNNLGTGAISLRNVNGYNPVGSSIPGTAFSLPASGTAWTNNTGVDGTLYVTGAGVVTAVVVQGVTVASSLSVGQSYFIPAGGTITLTYTTAPTLVFVGN